MKRLMLAALALFSFTAVTFAQEKPTTTTKKPKTESTTKKATTDTTHKKSTATKKHEPAKTAPAKKSS